MKLILFVTWLTFSPCGDLGEITVETPERQSLEEYLEGDAW